MPRNKKKLTAQDAFIGVRRPDPEPVEPPPADATPPATPDPAPESPKPAPSKRRRSPQSGKTNLNPDAELAAALAEAQAAMADRAAVERLTLYLPPDLAGRLDELYDEIRSTTQVKVGKSVIAAAALRIVLDDPAKRTETATLALREKLGG
ncbi:MAG TPA: hypothetical protein QGH10_03905 [Armatimonadota bacterium]|nr:hypothetical protein [Armatimonadota bacterium]